MGRCPTRACQNYLGMLVGEVLVDFIHDNVPSKRSELVGEVLVDFIHDNVLSKRSE